MARYNSIREAAFDAWKRLNKQGKRSAEDESCKYLSFDEEAGTFARCAFSIVQPLDMSIKLHAFDGRGASCDDQDVIDSGAFDNVTIEGVESAGLREAWCKIQRAHDANPYDVAEATSGAWFSDREAIWGESWDTFSRLAGVGDAGFSSFEDAARIVWERLVKQGKQAYNTGSGCVYDTKLHAKMRNGNNGEQREVPDVGLRCGVGIVLPEALLGACVNYGGSVSSIIRYVEGVPEALAIAGVAADDHRDWENDPLQFWSRIQYQHDGGNWDENGFTLSWDDFWSEVKPDRDLS